MDEVPSKGRVLDYGMRWGIEPMFSDFKSRGFSITKTQLRHADRIERLLLILTVALIGPCQQAWRRQKNLRPVPKKSSAVPDLMVQSRTALPP